MRFGSRVSIAALALVGSTSAYCAGTFVYVSNQDDADISTYTLQTEGGGRLIPGERVPAGKLVMPLASTSDARFLYASVRTKPYSVLAYRIDASTGGLRWIGTTPLPENMVTISIDRSNRWLLGTSYATNELSVNAIGADGRIDPTPAQFVSSGGGKPHSIKLDRDNRFAYVAHMSPSELTCYGFDPSTGQLDIKKATSAKDESRNGARHFVFSQDGGFVYLLGELTGVVMVYTRDKETGALKEIQKISSLPADSNLVKGVPRVVTGTPGEEPFDPAKVIWAADIQMTPDGRFVYTTERTRSTLTHFSIDPQTGLLKLIGHLQTEKQPRAIAIDPSGQFLIASGQLSDKLSLYAIDRSTGALTLRERVPAGKGANWVQIVQTH